MVETVTLNPALDRTLWVEDIRSDDFVRHFGMTGFLKYHRRKEESPRRDVETFRSQPFVDAQPISPIQGPERY
jgi:hypothetical protein